MNGDATPKEEILSLESDEARDRAVIDAGFVPGWLGLPGLKPEPVQDFLPHRWDWQQGRALLESAATSVNPKIAERRNIRMANPAEGKRTSLNTIHCSYQMVAGGEFARAHRHTVNAGRFILESDGAFTTFDGEKVMMERNDVVLTPNWVWHGLGNDSPDTPAFWIDFLDDPLVSLLKPMFYEVRSEIDADMPVRADSPFHIKWRDVDARLAAAPAGDGRHGRRIRLDSAAIPTMHLYMERLDAGEAAAPPKSTANRLFVAAEGSGVTTVAGRALAWRRGDVIAVPSWKDFTHRAESDAPATLFEITDEPVLEACGWYREAAD